MNAYNSKPQRFKRLILVILILIVTFFVYLIATYSIAMTKYRAQSTENEKVTAAAKPQIIVPNGCHQTKEEFQGGGGDGARMLAVYYSCTSNLPEDYLTSLLKPEYIAQGYSFREPNVYLKDGISFTYDYGAGGTRSFYVYVENER